MGQTAGELIMHDYMLWYKLMCMFVLYIYALNRWQLYSYSYIAGYSSQVHEGNFLGKSLVALLCINVCIRVVHGQLLYSLLLSNYIEWFIGQ